MRNMKDNSKYTIDVYIYREEAVSMVSLDTHNNRLIEITKPYSQMVMWIKNSGLKCDTKSKLKIYVEYIFSSYII